MGLISARAALLVSSCVVAGCSSGKVDETDASVTDTGAIVDSGPDAPPTCTLDAATESCTSCAARACSAQSSACFTDAACQAQLKCEQGCHDAACIEACRTSSPSSKADAYAACVKANCANPCCTTAPQ